jgi:hypothetical protein
MTTDERLANMLEKLEKLEERTELIARLDERGRVMAEQIEKISHTLLDGNGSPPLTVTVARLDERLQKLESVDDKKKLSGGDKALVYSTAVGGFLTLLEMVVRHLR